MDQRIQDFSDALKNESDRGCVLISLAIIDDTVANLIRAAMRNPNVKGKEWSQKIFEFNNALGTFSARLDLACAIGLLPDWMYNRLNLLRRFRNKFAHNTCPMSFEDSETNQQFIALIGKSLFERAQDRFLESDNISIPPLRAAFILHTAWSYGWLLRMQERVHDAGGLWSVGKKLADMEPDPADNRS